MDRDLESTCAVEELSSPFSESASADLAAAFRAIGDPVRFQLLMLIANSPTGTACSCDLESPVNRSQSTVSHHLSVLADSGLITKEKLGRWVNCSIVPDRLEELRSALA